jgi:hypothetical protein
MPLDRSKYFKGQAMIGQAYPGAFVIDGVLRQPPAPERKPAADPRLADLRARTAALAATEAKVELLQKRIEALAAQVRRP